MFYKLLTISIVIIGLAHPLLAQDKITIDNHRIISIANERATSILLAESQLEHAEAGINLARSWNSGPELHISGGQNLDTDDNSWGRGIKLKQHLDLWRRERIALATAGYEEQRARITALRASITTTSIKYFYRVIYYQEKLAILTESADLHQQLKEISDIRKQAGDIGALDLHVVSISAARTQTSKARAQAELQTAKDDLRILLGLDPKTTIHIDGDLSWKWQSPTWDPSQHPLLTQLRAGQFRADMAIQNAQAEGRPEVKVDLGYQHEEGEDYIQAGIGITFGSPGHTSARTRQAEINASATEILYRQTALELQQSFNGGHKRLQILSTALTSYNNITEKSISEAIKLSEKSYSTGVVAIGDVLSLRRELLDARLEQIGLQFDLINAFIDTAAASGSHPFNGVTPIPVSSDTNPQSTTTKD